MKRIIWILEETWSYGGVRKYSYEKAYEAERDIEWAQQRFIRRGGVVVVEPCIAVYPQEEEDCE